MFVKCFCVCVWQEEESGSWRKRQDITISKAEEKSCHHDDDNSNETHLLLFQLSLSSLPYVFLPIFSFRSPTVSPIRAGIGARVKRHTRLQFVQLASTNLPDGEAEGREGSAGGGGRGKWK